MGAAPALSALAFTGDHAGQLLYQTLIKFQRARGTYKAEPDDGVTLLDTRNEESWRLLERLGFKRKRTIKDADHFKGSPSDEYEYVRVLRA